MQPLNQSRGDCVYQKLGRKILKGDGQGLFDSLADA